MRRVLITLVALALWRLGLAVPIPGIDLFTYPDAGGASLSRFSILALGIVPWLSAVTLSELAVLLLPAHITARIASGGHANPFAKPIVVLALGFAVFQGYGIAVALEAIRNLVSEPGLGFRLSTSFTFAAGAAVTIALARVIQGEGIGWGFWVLLAAQSVRDVAQGAVQMLWSIQQGVAGPLAALAVAAASAAAIAAVVLLLETRRKAGLGAAEPIVWPLQLYGLVIPWVAVGLQIAAGTLADAGPVHTVLLPDRPLGALTMAALVTAFVMAYARREGGRALACVTAAVLIAIACIPLAARRLELDIVYLPSVGHLVLIGAAGYVIVTTLRERWNGRTN